MKYEILNGYIFLFIHNMYSFSNPKEQCADWNQERDSNEGL